MYNEFIRKEEQLMNLQKLGNFIAKKRKEHGYTQKDLADYIGISDKAISKWERGLSAPDIDNFEKLASALNVKLTDFWENGISSAKSEPVDNTIQDKELLVLYQTELQKAIFAQKKRKRRILSISSYIVALLIIGMVFACFPRKGANLLGVNSDYKAETSRAGEVIITVVGNTYQSGNMHLESRSYSFTKDSDAYKNLESLFQETSYHHTLKGLFSNSYDFDNQIGVIYITISIDNRMITVFPSLDYFAYQEWDDKGNITDHNYALGKMGYEDEAILCNQILAIIWATNCEPI